MDEERYLILKMLEEGKISAEEASALLEALGDGAEDARDGEEQYDDHGRPGRPHRPGRAGHRYHDRDYGFDREGFREGMEEMRRQLEKIRLGAIDIGDEVSRQVRDAMDSCRDEWRRSGRRPFRHFVRDIGDIFNVPAGREMYEESFEEEVALEPGSRVRVRALSGDVTVDAWDRDTVRVEARKRVWAATTEEAKERAADYRIRVEREGDELFIGARLEDEAPGWLPARCSIDYKVMVPAGSFLEVSVTNGDVRVSGVREGVDLRSTNGEVTTDGVAGSVVVHTTNGDITLKSAEPEELSLRSINGDVRAELVSLAEGENAVSAVRGDVRVAVRPGLRLDLRASTMHGDIRFGLPGTIASRTSTRLEVRLGAGEVEAAADDELVPALEIRTVFGDVSIERGKEG